MDRNLHVFMCIRILVSINVHKTLTKLGKYKYTIPTTHEVGVNVPLWEISANAIISRACCSINKASNLVLF